MITCCSNQDLQSTLLERERAGAPLDTAAAEHLATCEACQVASERLRRMSSVWMADHVDDAVIAVAEMRFHARESVQDEPKLWLGAMPFAGMGAVAGILLLVAARSMGPSHHVTPTAIPAAPVAVHSEHAGAAVAEATTEVRSAGPAAAVEKAVRGVPHVESPRGIMPLSDGARLELHEGETAEVSLSNGESSVVRGPCVVEFWSSATAVGGWRMAYAAQPGAASSNELPEEPSPRTALPENSVASALPSVTGETGVGAIANPAFAPAWARAAEALRLNDFAAADRAFSDLGHAPDAATRDAARLARAQLWMAHGRAKEVTPVLQDLAATGATPLVRQRAAEFLAKN